MPKLELSGPDDASDPGALDSDESRGSIRGDAGNLVRCRRDVTCHRLSEAFVTRPGHARIHLIRFSLTCAICGGSCVSKDAHIDAFKGGAQAAGEAPAGLNSPRRT